MTTKLVRIAALTALLLAAAGQAQADVVTVATGSVLVTPGSPDTFSLSAGSNTFSVPPNVPTTVGYQDGVLSIINDPADDGVLFPFTFSENVAINGDVQPVAFSGNIFVTFAQDTLSFDAGAVQSFAGMTVQFQPLSLSVPATALGDVPFTLQASITTPEPATLGLLGLALGAAGLLRRRRPSA